MDKIKLIILALSLCLYFQVLTFAEIIVLKSGETVEGKLVEKTDKYIKIDFQGVPLTYFLNEIQSVNKVDIQPTTIPNNKVGAQGLSDSAYQAGQDYMNQGKFDEAIVEFSKAIELNPRLDSVYYARARAYGAKDSLEKELADYDQVININSPETIQLACINRGMAYEYKGDLDKALAVYTKGIEAIPDPMSPKFGYLKQILYRNRAQIYLSRKEFDKVLDDVKGIEKLGGSVDLEVIKKIKNHGSNIELKVVFKESPEDYPGESIEENIYNSKGYQGLE
ncbi:MAG: tetratricopeptide repeat protein [Candidatus Omnitrophica bacterium]|nr:tetratricopeptide repeat protein [Candidatus Omnitrophota bacterium]